MSTHPNSNNLSGSGMKFVVVLLFLMGLLVYSLVNPQSPSSPTAGNGSHRAGNAAGVNPIEQRLKVKVKGKVAADIPKKEGIALALLIDTSGSMENIVTDRNGHTQRKIAVAQRCLDNLLGQIDRFGREHPDKPVLVGIYEFSTRDHCSSCRNLVPMQTLNHAAAIEAIRRVRTDGATPIGDAMIDAQRDLDGTGMSHLHILVVTDGENNQGYSPSDVAQVIFRRPPEDQSSIYFIAFDVAEEKFKAVKETGVLVLPAANEHELGQTLDYVLTGKILAEQPAVGG